MKVRDLITALAQHPPDHEAVLINEGTGTVQTISNVRAGQGEDGEVWIVEVPVPERLHPFFGRF